MKIRHLLPAMMIILVSCFQSQHSGVNPQIKTLIEVHNRGWNPVRVYLFRNGIKLQRLGFVEMNRTEVYFINPVNFNGAGEICLEEFSSRKSYCTGPLNPGPGSFVRIESAFNIEMSSYGIFNGRTP